MWVIGGKQSGLQMGKEQIFKSQVDKMFFGQTISGQSVIFPNFLSNHVWTKEENFSNLPCENSNKYQRFLLIT